MTEKRYAALMLVKYERIERVCYLASFCWALTHEKDFSDRVPTAALNWLLDMGYITAPISFRHLDRTTAMLSEKGYKFLAEAR